jgi:hypothetical protein
VSFDPARTLPADANDVVGPHDRCVRCGRPTPLGVSLCDDDNPGHIGAPSATQVHGTIFVGVVAGFILLAVGARLALGGLGPFPSTVLESAARPDGGADVVLTVRNEGTRVASATCRITRGGVARADDVLFQTEPIPVGGSVTIRRQLTAPTAGAEPLVADRLVVSCG